jgi:recombinational DNA repair ATPase RecF
MELKKLFLRNFRGYEEAVIKFNDGMNVILFGW